ncbi:MAG TPA: type II toxin-antitoxin system RelE/ParE family toxin [Chloroflexota bacterium]|nr:type II toxin-antitoxin system RelE/ParE family toxin [Chloroflexota bacterium]
MYGYRGYGRLRDRCHSPNSLPAAARRLAECAPTEAPPRTITESIEKLRGDLSDYYSIRVNDQLRVIFRWIDGDAYDVSAVDYH